MRSPGTALSASTRATPDRTALFVLAALALSACGSALGGVGVDEPIEIDTADRIAGLPSPVRPLASTTVRFQELWTAAQLALDEPLAPSDVADEEVFVSWLDRTLAPWLRERARAMERVKDRLSGLGAASADEKVMGAAVYGFLLEDTARQVTEADVPTNAARPARALELREALASDVRPLYAAAIHAYATCLEIEGGTATHLQVWRAHCDARERALSDE